MLQLKLVYCQFDLFNQLFQQQQEGEHKSHEQAQKGQGVIIIHFHR